MDFTAHLEPAINARPSFGHLYLTVYTESLFRFQPASSSSTSRLMPKPILLSVDDDSDVLRAIERDLRSQYGAEYRVIGSDSPEGALDLLKQLKVRNDSVALLLADQRMPRMDGVTFLQEAKHLFPEAKRALLTAYADTNAAISAINQASINYFFLKPWDPPSDHLYPQLNDLLDDRAFGFPARGGRRGRMNCAIFWRAITSPING